MKSVDRDGKKNGVVFAPRQYNMNVWTAVLQKNKYISFICGTFQSANNVLYQRLTFPNNTTFTPRSKVGSSACLCLNNNFDINKHTHHFTLFYLSREADIFHIIASHSEAHILHHWHHHIICWGRGSSVEARGDGTKVSYIFGGVEVVIKQFNLSKFNWKIFDVCVLPPNANEIIHWNKQICNWIVREPVFGAKAFKEENVRENTCGKDARFSRMDISFSF